MVKIIRAALGLVIFVFGFNSLLASSPASAATCVSDWPDNIFDEGFSGMVIETYNSAVPSSKTIGFAQAPLLKPEFSAKINQDSKNYFVKQKITIKNGLYSDYNISTRITAPLVFTTIKSASDGKVIRLNSPDSFAFTPGATLQSTISVETPNCQSRTFTSNLVTVPTYQVPDYANSNYRQDMNFKDAQAGDAMVQKIQSTHIRINETMNSLLQLDWSSAPFWGVRARAGFIQPDWNKCAGVVESKNSDGNEYFKIKDENSSFSCTIPIYLLANATDPEAVLANATFDYVAPSAQQSASPAPLVSSKTLTITCVKGKLTKKVIGANPSCPTGYKKK